MRIILYFVAFIIIIAGCQSNFRQTKFEPVDIQIQRFDQELFDISVYGIVDSIEFLRGKYPEFLPLFGNKIIEIGDPDMPGFNESMRAFLSDFTMYRVHKRVQEVFPDLNSVERELAEGFGRYKAFFPGYKIPEVISCLSGFNQSIITTENILVISLDKYLGSEDEFYMLLHPPIPEYQRIAMHPGKISSDALYGWLVSEFDYNSDKDNLLSQMIFKGRAMYAATKLLPEINDTVLWGFSRPQMQFCLKNEKDMWEYLVENKLLFESEKFRLNQFVNPAPFTKDFSQESPGRAVIWLGYRIIESCMKYQKELSFQNLMEEDDYMKLLQLSKYNP